jgi:hypothetical protein
MMDPFLALDSDTIANILTFLAPVDVIRLQRVNRRWHQLLSSKWIARLALVSHFPHSSEAMELRSSGGGEDGDGGDPVRSYRRAVYRSYTRAMGWPSRIQSFVLETGGGVLEWGTAGGELPSPQDAGGMAVDSGGEISCVGWLELIRRCFASGLVGGGKRDGWFRSWRS